jgi:hypothetical protein
MHPHANFISKPNPSRHPSFIIVVAALSPPPSLFQSPLAQLNHLPVVRSQKSTSRRKNHVESPSVASAIYHQSPTIVSYRCCDFFDELEVNLTSLVSSPYHALPPGLYGSEIRGL